MAYGTELVKGVHLRRNKSGVAVMRAHYTADPERDPAITPLWKEVERAKYSSQGAWDREQEIQATAGGGELVFRDILDRWANKIIITDPSFQIPFKEVDGVRTPLWRCRGGLDVGGTNPTTCEMAYIDYDGTIIVCGEYYQNDPGPDKLGVPGHARNLRLLPGFMQADAIMADPSIFFATQQQQNGKFKAIASMYQEEGFEHFQQGKNDELAGMERILKHWYDLEHREPTLKIVCRKNWDVPQFGLHPQDCPNLIWELRRTRREKLTAVQLMNRNPSEKIVDVDNHSRDALKYLVASLPEPTEKPREMVVEEAIKGKDPLNAYLAQAKVEAQFRKQDAPKVTGGTALRRGLITPKPFGRKF